MKKKIIIFFPTYEVQDIIMSSWGIGSIVARVVEQEKRQGRGYWNEC